MGNISTISLVLALTKKIVTQCVASSKQDHIYNFFIKKKTCEREYINMAGENSLFIYIYIYIYIVDVTLLIT